VSYYGRKHTTLEPMEWIINIIRGVGYIGRKEGDAHL